MRSKEAGGGVICNGTVESLPLLVDAWSTGKCRRGFLILFFLIFCGLMLDEVRSEAHSGLQGPAMDWADVMLFMYFVV